MKRLALSLVGGFAVPFLYVVTIGLIVRWTKNLALLHRLAIPVSWPALILFRLLPRGSFPFRHADRTFLILLVSRP